MHNRSLSPENLKFSKFQEIKQLDYFKKIFKEKEDPYLKEILPLHIIKCSLQEFDHDNFIYIPEKSKNQCEAGSLIDESVNNLPQKIPVFKISKKLDKILRYVVIMQIPVLCKYKPIDRFKILNQSAIQNYPYNRTVFRKKQAFEGIFYIINGELKVINQKAGSTAKVIPKDNFIGLKQIYDNSPIYLHTIISNSNHTKLLFIKNHTLYEQKYEEQMTLKELFKKYYEQTEQKSSKIKRGDQSKLTTLCISKKENKLPLSMNIFIKKSEQFRSNTTRHDPGFNQYLRSKKVMLQLKETMMLNKQSKLNTNNKENSSFQITSNIDKNRKMDNEMRGGRSSLLKSSIMKRFGTMSKEFTSQDMMDFGMSTIKSLDLQTRTSKFYATQAIQ